MSYGTAVGGRTRSRLALLEKQDLERKNQSKEQTSVEEFGSDHTSEEEGLSVDSESDDVLFVEERDVDTVSVDDNDVLVIEESDVDSVPVDDDDDSDDDEDEDLLFTEEQDKGNRPGQGVEDVERSKSSGETDRAEFRLKRKKVYGLDCTDENPVQESGCVAQRTRSHFNSKLGPSKLKLGTFSRPLCVDEEEEESESLSEQGDLSDDGGKISHIGHKRKAIKKKSGSTAGVSNRVVDNHGEFFNGRCLSESDEENISGDESEGLDCKQKAHRKGEPAWKNHEADPKDFDAVKILQDSLSGEGEMPLQKFASSSDEEGNLKVTEACLPLRFTFGNKESKPPEKSEDDKELDKLWDEMEECLYASEHDSGQVENNHVCDPHPVEEVSSTTSGHTKVSRATLCQRGEHYLTLNEEIGLICKHCSHVSLEIKYCDPPFNKNPWGNSYRRDSCTLDNAGHPVFNDLQLQISGCDEDSSGYDSYVSTGTVWDIIPGLKKSMFPHQCEAFEFLWMNLAGGIFLDQLKEHLDFASGSGCIISHAPGTGKTRLTIVFLQTFLGLYPTCRPMIIAPSNMLLTWEEEFEKWKVPIPFHNLNKPEYSGKENEVAMSLLKKSGCHVHSTNSIRLMKLYSWKKDRSVLGISYTLFEKLAGQNSINKDIVIKKALLELPGLLVLDEGHTPRNAQSLIFKALSEIKTHRRIILSGTPFQNNFVELYNTLCLVKPKFAEWNSSEERMVVDEKGGRRLFNSFSKVRSDSEKDKILNDIRRIIKPLVHLHKGTILQESLPGLRELVVILKPTQLQRVLLEDIQKTRKSHLQGKEGSLKLDHLESITAVHPSILLIAKDKEKLERARLNPEDGVKTKFLMELIRLSELMNEKVLVFSQYIDPLTFLTDQLKSHFSWIEGREMLQMHGKFDLRMRQDSIKAFNDPTSKVRVLLASTKACFEGINLVGASRVVLLDVVWNPSVERQAVSRAYRLGQKKVVYSYHLITSGTRDEQKCSRQAEKDQLSELVFSCSDRADHRRNISSADLEDKILEKMVHNENLRHIFEKVAINRRTIF